MAQRGKTWFRGKGPYLLKERRKLIEEQNEYEDAATEDHTEIDRCSLQQTRQQAGVVDQHQRQDVGGIGGNDTGGDFKETDRY